MADITQIGHYLIQELLRQGRSADSYVAENASIRSQKVLLRVLHPDTAKDPVRVREFMDEVRTAARLDHNCIASVLDLKDDGERVYAVLEYIDGLELGDLVARYGPPPPEVAVAIMHEVCSALEHAHGKSVLHRHLRPRHVKLTPEGGVKVLGFGLRERDSVMQSVVMPDAMRDELYRAPEQVREQPEDARTDLYALGVVMYELLTLRMPFETFVGPATQGAGRKPAPVFSLNPLVPTTFARLIERLLSERREDRPADAAAVRRSLDDLLDAYRVMHSTDVLRSYFGNPRGYAEKARPAALASLLRDAETLAKGGDADRRAALEELERLLAEDPRNNGAVSLVRKLRPSSSDPGPLPTPPAAPAPAAAAPVPPAAVPAPPAVPAAPPPDYDPEKTMIMLPGEQPAARAVPPPPPVPAAPSAPPPPPAPRPAPPPADLDRTLPPVSRPAPPPPAAMPPPARPGAAAAAAATKLRGLLIGAGIAVVVLALAVVAVVWHPWSGGSQPVVEAPEPSPAVETLTLAVETTPPGAQVLLPATGETHLSPATFAGLPAGETRVRITLAGFQTRDTTIALGPDGPGALRLALMPSVALGCTLFVAVQPKADQVLIDGLPATAVDSASWFMSVAPGTHSVDVSAAGFERWNRVKAAKLAAGANGRLSVLLDPLPQSATGASGTGAASYTGDKPWLVAGGVSVAVDCEPEAQLFVDGVAYPTLVRSAALSMAPGEHRFRFVHPDYVEAVKDKRIKAGQKGVRIRQDFRVGSGILSIYAKSSGNQIFVRGKFKGYPNLVVREVEPGRCRIELRDKAGVQVIASKEVIVENSSVPIEVRFD